MRCTETSYLEVFCIHTMKIKWLNKVELLYPSSASCSVCTHIEIPKFRCYSCFFPNRYTERLSIVSVTCLCIKVIRRSLRGVLCIYLSTACNISPISIVFGPEMDCGCIEISETFSINFSGSGISCQRTGELLPAEADLKLRCCQKRKACSCFHQWHYFSLHLSCWSSNHGHIRRRISLLICLKRSAEKEKKKKKRINLVITAKINSVSYCSLSMGSKLWVNNHKIFKFNMRRTENSKCSTVKVFYFIKTKQTSWVLWRRCKSTSSQFSDINATGRH